MLNMLKNLSAGWRQNTDCIVNEVNAEYIVQITAINLELWLSHFDIRRKDIVLLTKICYIGIGS